MSVIFAPAARISSGKLFIVVEDISQKICQLCRVEFLAQSPEGPMRIFPSMLDGRRKSWWGRIPYRHWNSSAGRRHAAMFYIVFLEPIWKRRVISGAFQLCPGWVSIAYMLATGARAFNEAAQSCYYSCAFEPSLGLAPIIVKQNLFKFEGCKRVQHWQFSCRAKNANHADETGANVAMWWSNGSISSDGLRSGSYWV